MEPGEDIRQGRSRRRGKAGKGERLYWHADKITEIMIYAGLIFMPWAFGTTERWAIRTMNAWNYILGGLLVMKWVIRAGGWHQPMRWGNESVRRWPGRVVTWGLAVLTVILLGMCCVSAWNARATFNPMNGFTYFETYRQWLPHSYSQNASWFALAMYLGAACYFWALRDWLLTKEAGESGDGTSVETTAFAGPEDRGEMGRRSGREARFPRRLKRLLWVISINGALLALEGTLQRLSGTEKLLWMVQPELNRTAQSQFGPFAYRTNGAQYLNLIWPVSLAFWWGLHQQRRKKLGEGAEFLLLPLTGLMLAAPIVATSRGGMGVAVAQALASGAILAWGFRRSVWKATAAIGILAALVGGGAYLQWDFLKSRLNEANLETLGGRTEIYENSKGIAEDFPLWGTGPGTFAAVYYLYRSNPSDRWYAHAHDDYLETLITLGRVGLTATLLAVALAIAHWPLGRGVPATGLFVSFVFVAMAGALGHAKWDFPFQVYSVLLMFLTLCAMLAAMGRRPAEAS